MKVFADLQLHSRYAIATSRDMDLEHLAEGGRRKGLNLLGTGDFTHPRWLSELKSKLEPESGAGLYTYRGMRWMLSGEVCTVYEQGGKKRKVHHLIYSPDFEVADHIVEALSPFGNLASDGRPVLTGIDSPGLVEVLTQVSDQVVVIPAHAWTPWFGALGSKSGFDSLKECYGDQAHKIFALETGLSSDPPMNWRLEQLDDISLVSNSDAHSPNPWRLGREANVFELEEVTYKEVFSAIRGKNPSRFLFTIEVDPSYGKYHYSGHKKCGISLSPSEAAQAGNRCPKCGRKLTVGVLQRVGALADRSEGYVRPGGVPFKRLLPLSELISRVRGLRSLLSKKVLEQQDALIAGLGSELRVLLEASHAEITKLSDPKVADAVMTVREGRLDFTPGYDGVYGVPLFEHLKQG